MTRWLLIPFGVVFMFALVLVSMPWLLWAIGVYAYGDAAGFDRAMNASPFVRYMDWRDGWTA